MFAVSVESDIAYSIGATENGEIDLRLDVYRPQGTGAPALAPALVWVHGGGWESGDKAMTILDHVLTARAFASRGYVVAAIEYRLAGDRPTAEPFFETTAIASELVRVASLGILPFLDTGHYTDPPGGSENLERAIRAVAASAEDTSRAIAWVRSHHAELGVDPDRIAAGGWSAGATAALLAAYGGVFGAESRVGAVLSVCGSLFENHELIAEGAAPLLLSHGEADPIVPIAWARDMSARASATGVPMRLLAVPGAGHCPRPGQIVGRDTLLDHYVEFFYQHLDLEQLLSGPTLLRGDSNTDGVVDLSDAVTTLAHLFLEAEQLSCKDAADANDDGVLDISDPIAVLGYLFLGDSEIPAPGTSVCGPDPSEDDLDCAAGGSRCDAP